MCANFLYLPCMVWITMVILQNQVVDWMTPAVIVSNWVKFVEGLFLSYEAVNVVDLKQRSQRQIDIFPQRICTTWKWRRRHDHYDTLHGTHIISVYHIVCYRLVFTLQILFFMFKIVDLSCLTNHGASKAPQR